MANSANKEKVWKNRYLLIALGCSIIAVLCFIVALTTNVSTNANAPLIVIVAAFGFSISLVGIFRSIAVAYRVPSARNEYAYEMNE